MTPEIEHAALVERYRTKLAAYRHGTMRNAAYRGIAESIAEDVAWTPAEKGGHLMALTEAGKAADSQWSGRTQS